MSWLKGLFGGKSDGSQALVPLTDREYEQLFLQVLQGVAANWDEQRLLKLLGNRCGDRQMVVWLRGYGDRLLSEPANPDLVGLLVRLGEIGCGELGVVAQGIGLEMGNIPVEQVMAYFPPTKGNKVQNLEAEMFYHKGLVALQANRYEEALEYFDCAVYINPEHDKAWNRKGLVLANLGRYEECIISFGESARLNPDDDIAWYGKGLALENLGKYEDAIICYEYIISINSNNHGAWNSKGLCLTNLGRDEEAILAYDQAISIKYDSNRVWNNKGISLANLGRDEEAIASFDSEISILPNDVSYYNRGLSLYRLGRYEQAIISYNFAIDIKPDKHEAWCDKGLSLAYLGKYEEAITSYDISLAISQGNYWKAYLGRGDSALHSDGRGKGIILTSFGQRLSKKTQNSALDLRGYQGQLASFNEGFKYINQETELEGWGQLHKAIGNAHYSHGKNQPNPFPFWHQAIISYENALKALTPKFEAAHLETLRDYVRVLLALHETEKAEGLLRKGTDFLEARLKEKSGRIRELFERKFRPYFNELTVGLYIQQGKLTEALEIAEKDKNAFLRDGLLADTTESSPDYPQMCAFLKQQPNIAIIYWHLSDNALTTFILFPNSLSEITLNLLPTPTTENATLTQRNQLTDWITAWQNDYAEYGGKKTKSKSQETKAEAKSENHPWRFHMEERLATLKNILRITDIEKALADSTHCTQLLLIPHRDLHLYPLDSLFDPKYTIAYLPSIQVGIKLLKHQPKPNYKRLLSIENPDSSITLEDGTTQNLPKLTAAEAESELICRMYEEPICLPKDKNTLAEVTTQLTTQTPQPHTIFHFTGHGYYDFFSPNNSALALSGSDRLTRKEIGNLDLSSYQLACLSACETAIAVTQTITQEYAGLTSAFMYSGVAKVVSTLWTVESISSALLMIEFHRCYVAGESADVALATAKNWLRNATSADLAKWYQNEIDDLPPDHSLIPWLRDRLDDLSQNDLDQISASTDLKPYNHPYHWSAFTITGL